MVLAAAAGIGLWAIFSRQDFGFALVIVWALFGIYSKRTADSNAADGAVETAALFGMGLLGVGIIYLLLKGR